MEGRVEGHPIVILRARPVEGCAGKTIVGRALGRRVARHAGVEGFHHVDFPARGPGAVDRLIGMEHPERGPHALAARQTGAELYPTVAEFKLVLSVDTRRAIGGVGTERVIERRDLQGPARHLNVVRGIGLELVIAEAAEVRAAVPFHNVPLALIQLRAIKLIGEDQLEFHHGSGELSRGNGVGLAPTGCKHEGSPQEEEVPHSGHKTRERHLHDQRLPAAFNRVTLDHLGRDRRTDPGG